MILAGALFLAACETDRDPMDDPALTTEEGMDDDMTGMDDPMGTTTGTFDTWDTDRDTYLTRQEFNTRFDQDRLFGRYDTDGTGYLNENQFNTGVVGTGFDTAENFRTYDTDGDGQISREEFRTGLFDRMDADGDGRISREEFRRFDTMMGTGTAPGTTPADGM